MGGLANKFSQAQQNPLFMGGLGLLSSGDIGGLLQGTQVANDLKQQAQKQQQQKAWQQKFQKAMGGGGSGGGSGPGATPPFVPPGIAGTGGVSGVMQGLGGGSGAPSPQAPPAQSGPDMMQLAQVMASSPDPQIQAMGLRQMANVANFQRDNSRSDMEYSRQIADQQKQADAQLARQKELAEFRAGFQRPDAQTSAIQNYLFNQNLSPEEQEKFLLGQRAAQFTNVAGVEHQMTPDGLVPLTTIEDVAKNEAATATAKTTATEEAKDQVKGSKQLAGMTELGTRLEKMITNPDFSASVGPIDQVTGRIGAMFGSDEGILGQRAQQTANELVQQVAQTWSGAISDAELKLFQQTVPSRGDSAASWRDWYYNTFQPKINDLTQRYGVPEMPEPETKGQEGTIDALVDKWTN